MMVRSLVKRSVELGLINENNAEIYEYGVADMLYNLFTCGVFLIVGLYINVFWQVLLFTLVHIPFRTYAGGLHFATRLRCFCASLVVFSVVFTLPYIFTEKQLAIVIMWVLLPNILITWQLAPVEDMRKPLNKKERQHHGKVSLLICIICVGSSSVCFFLSLYSLSYYIGVATTVVSIQLILGELKNRSCN